MNIHHYKLKVIILIFKMLSLSNTFAVSVDGVSSTPSSINNSATVSTRPREPLPSQSINLFEKRFKKANGLIIDAEITCLKEGLSDDCKKKRKIAVRYLKEVAQSCIKENNEIPHSKEGCTTIAKSVGIHGNYIDFVQDIDLSPYHFTLKRLNKRYIALLSNYCGNSFFTRKHPLGHIKLTQRIIQKSFGNSLQKCEKLIHKEKCIGAFAKEIDSRICDIQKIHKVIKEFKERTPNQNAAPFR
jgi:hypothetical protein